MVSDKGSSGKVDVHKHLDELFVMLSHSGNSAEKCPNWWHVKQWSLSVVTDLEQDLGDLALLSFSTALSKRLASLKSSLGLVLSEVWGLVFNQNSTY